jgi:hypothetical protein
MDNADRPLGSERFVVALEERLGRLLRRKSPGRLKTKQGRK